MTIAFISLFLSWLGCVIEAILSPSQFWTPPSTKNAFGFANFHVIAIIFWPFDSHSKSHHAVIDPQ